MSKLIYVPLLKTRQEELRVAKELSSCFSDKIIPLFEILNDVFKPRYKVDSITGDFIYEQGQKRKNKIRVEPIDSDIITLDSINKIIESKKAFIDYFRFTKKKYGSDIDVNKVVLARRMNDDVNLYKNKIKEISRFSNLIPVVSIKDGFKMQEKELGNLLRELKNSNESVALRITDEFTGTYQDVLENILTSSDYLLFDIEEQSPRVKFMELEEVTAMNIGAKIILLNSPRKVKIENGDYPENAYTDRIDNCAKDMTAEYDLDGYGDYCGLRDKLPSGRGANGLGRALALMYDYNKNAFWSYMNENVKEGMGGYKKLTPLILKDSCRFDPQNKCHGYKKIVSLKGSGNWGTWLNICARRYISQVYENIN